MESLGHSEISQLIANGIYSREFLLELSKSIMLLSGRLKEHELKIAVTTTILNQIDKWVTLPPKNYAKKPINPFVATEFSLPSLDNERSSVRCQEFDWLIGQMHPLEKANTNFFLPPTDIVIGPTGWVPDPAYSYSLLLGVELKVFNDGVNSAKLNKLKKDIDKGIKFLTWQRQYLDQNHVTRKGFLPENYMHIPNGIDCHRNNAYFYFIGVCDQSELLKIIIKLLSNWEKVQVSWPLIYQSTGLYIARMKLRS